MLKQATIVFDLDGTLVDTAPDLSNALNDVMTRRGHAPVPAETVRACVGHGARVMIEQALRRAGASDDVDRMLADERSRSLVSNFAGQWLYLRNLDSITPDLRLFPDFDDNLRQAFRQETELFFESVLREDRSVLDLITADYTYLNERLARHYRIPHVYGNRFRRVSLDKGSHRGGLLRHGSILTVTSPPARVASRPTRPSSDRTSFSSAVSLRRT